MLFNSYEFIFLFLPAAVLLYFVINRWISNTAGKVWLVIASLFFYSWWNLSYLPLILLSVGFNYTAGRMMERERLHPHKRTILVLGVIANLGLLGYYKYADFFIANVNTVFSANLPLLRLTLPLAISFFTFQQISYLVDTYRGETQESGFLHYALFVTFFPQLIAGPIVLHREMMPQFLARDNKKLSVENLSLGLYVFMIGLFKKVMIADSFAVWATYGFDGGATLTLIEAWIVSLSYTFQLYFDFSGYSDMAIGAALMFNLRLAINFDSPYKSLNIQEFWRRWHITLGRFLRQYVYIPLGGNRGGNGRIYRNLMITILLGGLWHGAGWTFVFWGFLHGLALVIHRMWQQTGWQMNRIIAWFLTFNFVNFAWVFFRARSWEEAIRVIHGMLGLNGVVLPASFAPYLQGLQDAGVQFQTLLPGQNLIKAVGMIVVFLILHLIMPNSMQLRDRFKPTLATALITAILGVSAVLGLTHVSEFLYFNF